MITHAWGSTDRPTADAWRSSLTAAARFPEDLVRWADDPIEATDPAVGAVLAEFSTIGIG